MNYLSLDITTCITEIKWIKICTKINIQSDIRLNVGQYGRKKFGNVTKTAVVKISSIAKKYEEHIGVVIS